MSHQDLQLHQRIMEQQTIERGIERYRQRTTAKVKREGFDKHDGVQQLVRGAIPILSEALQAWLDEASKAKGRKHTAYTALSLLDMDTVAAIAVVSLFQGIEDGRVVRLASKIGQRIEIELEGAAVAERSFKEAERFLKLAEGNVPASILQARFREMVERNEAGLYWSEATQVLVGQTVLNVALVALEGLFVQKTRQVGKVKQAVVELTDEACEALVQMEDAAALAHLPLRPMVTKPRAWQHMTSGAYGDYRLARQVPMVRVRNKEDRQAISEAIRTGQMDEVLTALNAIQDTRWAIDTRVLAFVLWARDEGLQPSPSFPVKDLPVPPAKVDAETWEAMDQAERSARSRQRRSILELRKSLTVGANTFNDDTAEAINLSSFEAFYLPHSLDFRGRVYAVPYFNHQRSDHMKALFRFADGVPLGEHGGKWLMIHLANTGDFQKVSKKPFEQRIAWVKENEAAILATAADPAANAAWWSEADSPFCFLQACFEYAEWAESGYSPDFLSTIPGAADGSCSGLQHYSAITRSEDEAYHVNLLPRPDVGDIYMVTAERARPTLEAAAAGGDLAAQVILENGFGRGEVKRNVMTYFYGSGRFGMRQQHMDDLMRPLADKVALGELKAHPYALETERTDKETGEVTKVLDGGFACATTLAAHVYAAVTSVAAKADEAATWVQKVTSILAHEGLPLKWTTQTGMPVTMRYMEYEHKRVNMWLYDRSIKVPSSTDKVDHQGNILTRIRVLIQQAPTKRMNKKAMRNASSPNVIHSMDAAHLQRTVAMAKAEGIEHFAMIHDSFGTHLGNMERFTRIVREAFVSCYETYCPLQVIDAYARSVLSEEGIDKLPALPARGSLELTKVLEAPFAFA
jgi:DNA-directed RNA polymerase